LQKPHGRDNGKDGGKDRYNVAAENGGSIGHLFFPKDTKKATGTSSGGSRL
jgi:hypothetical protein